MSDGAKSTVSGMSFTHVLGLIFIVLKLCNVIDWSWWWVTSPLWIPWAIILSIFAAVIVLCAIGGLIGLLITIFE